MLIRCVGNCGGNVPPEYHQRSYTRATLHKNLTIGKSYCVHAEESVGGLVYFYICDDDYHWYPMRYPAPLFEIVDARRPTQWAKSDYAKGDYFVAHRKWLAMPDFYDRLVDMEKNEVELFAELKIELELNYTVN